MLGGHHMYQHVWCMLILCNESRAVLQKIFQCNAYNNNHFTVQTVNEMHVQCVRYCDPRHAADDVSVNWYCEQWCTAVVHGTPLLLPALINWSNGIKLLVMAHLLLQDFKWHKPSDLNPGCCRDWWTWHWFCSPSKVFDTETDTIVLSRSLDVRTFSINKNR